MEGLVGRTLLIYLMNGSSINGLAPNGGVNYPPTRKIENFHGKNIPYDKTLRLFEQNLVF